MSSQIEQVQPDIFAKLNSEPYFAAISLFAVRKERFESEIKEALATATFDAGQSGRKPGATIEVLMPMIRTNLVNAPGPVVTLEQRIVVKENPELNLAEGGTGLTAEQIAVQVLQTLHQFYLGGVCQALYPAPQAIVENRDFPGLVAYDVILYATLPLAPLARASSPSIASADGPDGTDVITLTDTEPDGGSVIYYTTDGSFPGPGNPAAEIYSESVTIDPGDVSIFRWAAYKSDKLGSSTGWASIN